MAASILFDLSFGQPSQAEQDYANYGNIWLHCHLE